MGTTMGRWMAIDLGDRRIGIAIADPIEIGAKTQKTTLSSGISPPASRGRCRAAAVA